MNNTSNVLLGAGVLLVAAAASAAVVTQSPKAAATTTPITVVTVPAPVTAPALAVATTLPKTTAPAAATNWVATDLAEAPATLKPLDLSDMWLWNWGGKWMASEWANGNAPIAWKYDHVTQVNRADTIFKLDAAGAPQLQAMGGTAASTSGLWETDVTLPVLKEGLIVAPLWVYDAASADEIDFEFAGRRGLDVSLHAKVNGVMQKSTVRLFAGVDMSGQRKRFGIKVDQTAGFVEMYVDSRLVYRWNRSTMSFFVTKPLKPWIEMWPANPNYSGFVQWVGRWQGLASGETLSMTVHGYGYTPPAK